MTLPPSVSLSDSHAACPILQILHPCATGSVALLGGHVLEWKPATTGHPVLYMSPESAFAEGTAIRGGIPVCWPWFGPRPGQPSHGFVRTRFWELLRASESDAGVTLDLALASDPGTLDLWPHPFRLELTVSMGLTLEVALRMLNLSDQPVEITGALHTYLCTGAITQTFVHGLDGASYLDTIDGHQTKLQKGPVHFDQEVDRIYQTSQPVEVEDLKWKRTLRITNQGSHSTVVWNPWIEKSKRLPDLPDDAYPHFLCIEAANAGIDLVHLPPGGSHTLATRIEVR